MNLEIFNLLGNETKNFVSSFVNELAKALDKGNNMNIGVVYGCLLYTSPSPRDS